MTPDIKNILYATNLSKNAPYAFRYAIHIASNFKARVTILHVMEEMHEEARLTFNAFFDKETKKEILSNLESNVVTQVEEFLLAFCIKEFPENVEDCTDMVTVKVCKGHPEEQILLKSKEYQSDVIVMGTHEKGFAHTFLGSVAKRVISRSRIPVFVIPLPKQ